MDLRRRDLGLRGGSGMLGGSIRRRMVNSSRPSGEVVFLSRFMLAASSGVINIWLIFSIVFCKEVLVA